MSNQTYNNLNVSNSINTTNLQCNNVVTDTLNVNSLSMTDLNLSGKINNNITLQNLNSLDTTSSITSQFINAKNYTDGKINLLLNNPDANINSISELFSILGNDPNLNIVNSLGDKISKTENNQTISALNMNWTNPIISSDFTIKNSDNTTKSVKSSISSIESGKLNSNLGVGTNNVLYSPLIAQHLYVQNANINQLVKTKTECWNIISSNLSSGQKELNFLNFDTSYYNDGTVKAFVFHKLNNSSTNTYDDFFIIYNNGNAKLKGDLVIGSNNISLTTLNTNLTSLSGNLSTNYYLKTDTYSQSETNALVDGITQPSVGKIAISKMLGIGTTNPTSQLHVVGATVLNGNATITGNLNTASVSTASNVTSSGNVVCLGLISGNVLQCNSGSTLTLNRDFPNGITNVIGKLGVGVSSPSTALDINGSVNASGNINANSLTIGTSLNVEDYLYNSSNLINTNTNNISTNTTNINIIRTYLNTYPKFGFSGSQTKLVSGNQYTTQLTPTITFTNKNPNVIRGFTQPITFSVKAFFYSGSNVNQTTFDIMFLPVAFSTWGNTTPIYNFNNDIGSNGAFSASNRPFWTFNQVFTSNAVPKGNITAIATDYTSNPPVTYQTYNIYFYFQFTNPSAYSISIEALDISNALSDFDVSIGLT